MNTGKLNPWKLTGYKAGQNVACKVMAVEPGGYAVICTKDNLPGFLPTEEKFKIGEEVLAQFVCVHNNRVLLSSKFAAGQITDKRQAKPEAVNWQEQLQNYQQQQSGAQAPTPGNTGEYGAVQQQGLSGQQAAVPQQGNDPAFAAWSQQATPRKLHLKRATDLIVPPQNGEQPNTVRMGDYDLDMLIMDLEGGMRTGIVRANSEPQLSRSALLIYKGRAVGCIYGRKGMNDSYPTETSLALMLGDMALPDTIVSTYSLPEEVVLSLSALFLGYPVTRQDDLDARSYMDYLCGWFAEKGQTACLASALPSTGSPLLVYVTHGQFVGGFYVDEQKLSRDREYIYQILASDPQAGMEASILPPEMTSSAVRFGFSLSMAMKQNR
jgi:hypothetical protein